MSYCINYDGEQQRQPKARLFCFLMTVSFFLVFIWSVNTFWPEGRDLFKLLIIPGDPGLTMEAAEVFATDLRSGIPWSTAAGSFCRAVFSRGYSD